MKGVLQVVVIIIGIVAICISIFQHGKAKTGKHNFFTDFIVILVEFIFLYVIGFFR